MRDPTPKQNEVLAFIIEYMRKYEISPSFREIGDFLGISVGTVQDQVYSLQRLGQLARIPGKARSIKLTGDRQLISTRPLLVLGVISAGEGITVFEDPDPEIVDVPSSMLMFGQGYYCLRVSGFSMVNDGILDGDTIVIRQQATAQDGETVIAIIQNDPEEKATLKKFYHHGNQIELRPRNQHLRSKFYAPENIEVRGKFAGLIRNS